MIQRFPFTPILGWSVSRFDTFAFCKRKYYYTYYAKFDREFPTSKIMALRSLTTEALSIGSIAHDIIKVILERLQKSTEAIDQDKLTRFIRNEVDKYCLDKVFSEVYYKEREEVSAKDLIPAVTQNVMNFLNSERYEWIRQLPEESKRHWIIEPAGFGETRIGQLKAYCKVDFMFPNENEIYILDWKTGKPDDFKHRKQLIGYSLFATYHFKNNFEKIIPIVAYLKDGYREEIPKISQHDIDSFEDEVAYETRQMQNYNRDIENNTPIDKEDFALTENTNACKYCEFRELCGRQ